MPAKPCFDRHARIHASALNRFRIPITPPSIMIDGEKGSSSLFFARFSSRRCIWRLTFSRFFFSIQHLPSYIYNINIFKFLWILRFRILWYRIKIWSLETRNANQRNVCVTCLTYTWNRNTRISIQSKLYFRGPYVIFSIILVTNNIFLFG